MIIKSLFSRFWLFVVFARFPLLVLAFFWLFTVNVFASCRVIAGEILLGSQTFRMQTGGNCSGNYPYSNQASVSSFCSSISCPAVVFQNGSYYAGLFAGGAGACRGSAFSCNPDQLSFGSSCYNTNDYSCGSVRCIAQRMCDTQAEADSVNCELNPDSEGCDDRCAVYRQQCEQLGGVFSGSQTPTGCAASCNTCGNTANKNILEIKVQSCCSQGLAPSVERMCITPDIATGDGMQVSSNANLDCVDPNLDDDNLNLYVEYCSDNPPGSSSSQATSSSGGGGSSGSDDSSSSSGESGNSSGSNVPGEMFDYYPILDTIRDSLVNIKKNVNNIYICLITPGACGGMNPKISIPSDSNFLKNINSTINTTNTLLDSSLRNGNERLKNAIASANDTLIDSLRKFLGGSSAGFSGDTLGDSLGRIHRTLEDFKAMFEAGEIDTTGFGAEYGGYIARGEQLKDSIIGALGWADIDTINIDSLYSRALNGSKIDSVSGAVDDSLGLMAGKLGDSLSRKTDSLRKALPGVLDSLADSLVIWAPFADFDSIIYSTIGAHVPNRADCPEDCQKWTVSIPIIGLHSYTVDFGLCLGRASFGGLSVLGFLKLLIRLIVAYICIMTAYKVLVRMI